MSHNPEYLHVPHCHINSDNIYNNAADILAKNAILLEDIQGDTDFDNIFSKKAYTHIMIVSNSNGLE